MQNRDRKIRFPIVVLSCDDIMMTLSTMASHKIVALQRKETLKTFEQIAKDSPNQISYQIRKQLLNDFNLSQML